MQSGRCRGKGTEHETGKTNRCDGAVSAGSAGPARPGLRGGRPAGPALFRPGLAHGSERGPPARRADFRRAGGQGPGAEQPGHGLPAGRGGPLPGSGPPAGPPFSAAAARRVRRGRHSLYRHGVAASRQARRAFNIRTPPFPNLWPRFSPRSWASRSAAIR